jgi:hypothetical protein
MKIRIRCQQGGCDPARAPGWRPRPSSQELRFLAYLNSRGAPILESSIWYYSCNYLYRAMDRPSKDDLERINQALLERVARTKAEYERAKAASRQLANA